ncbi:hypothetical protein PIROE2DRAFT_8476 [Piromyces sp. E2]|nr:hypothetical protein PIROE2DRAFT_8476 [Piromyces sp. E2]|eukprot:OUM64708.1 hypothetical protein PIROE2DRAFT_8476 [Piromyces sp. E2]
MRDLHEFGEHFTPPSISNFKSLANKKINDAYQISCMTYINNLFFPWVCLVFYSNRKNWKRPVMIILILYWFLQSTGNLFQSYLNYKDLSKYNGYEWPFTKTNWYIINATAHLFWVSGEIIADWYPYLRTKALIHDKKKLKPIFITCVIFNIVKVCHIISNFGFVPSSFKITFHNTNMEMLRYKIVWWTIVMVLQMINLTYDIFVIIALKNRLFNKLESFKSKSNNFLEKFKQISEYRIFLSIIISIISFPWAFLHLLNILNMYYRKDEESPIEDIYPQVENLRVIGLRFMYTFMYIDQILLRLYLKKNNNKPGHYKNSYSSTSSSMDSQLLINPSSSSTVNAIPFNNMIKTSSINEYKKPLSFPNTINEQNIPKTLKYYSNIMTSNNKVNSFYYLKKLENMT